MKLAIGTDHRGRELKEQLISLLEKKYEIVDCSKENYDTDDYPDFAFKVCNSVLNNSDFGVLLCGTGIGMSIAANKVKGIRCALVHNINEAHLAKEHNNANVIAFSSALPIDEIIKCIDEFANTSFSNQENHQRRVEKIIKYENGEYNEL